MRRSARGGVSALEAAGGWKLGRGRRPNKPETNEPLVPSKYATYGGESAIVTYALLAAGQNTQSEPIKKAVDWLEHVDLHGTYAIGLRAQVWNMLPEKERSRLLRLPAIGTAISSFSGGLGKGLTRGFTPISMEPTPAAP